MKSESILWIFVWNRTVRQFALWYYMRYFWLPSENSYIKAGAVAVKYSTVPSEDTIDPVCIEAWNQFFNLPWNPTGRYEVLYRVLRSTVRYRYYVDSVSDSQTLSFEAIPSTLVSVTSSHTSCTYVFERPSLYQHELSFIDFEITFQKRDGTLEISKPSIPSIIRRNYTHVSYS